MLEGLDLVDANFHGETLADQIERQDHPKIVLLADQYSGHAGEGARGDAHFFSHNQIGVGFEVTEGQTGTQGLNFGRWKRRQFTPSADNRKDAGDLQNLYRFAPVDANENVAGKAAAQSLLCSRFSIAEAPGTAAGKTECSASQTAGRQPFHAGESYKPQTTRIYQERWF